jgi:hypothetical protein
VQAKVEEMYFIFNLEYRYAALSRGMLHRLSTKSNAKKSKENQMVRFPKPEGPIWADEL